jgi:hypothetical protein
MTPVGTDFGSVPRRGEKQPGKGKRETQHTQSEGGKAAREKGETVTWGGAECGKGGKVMINRENYAGTGDGGRDERLSRNCRRHRAARVGKKPLAPAMKTRGKG